MIKIKIKNYKKETPELKEEFKKLGLQAFDSLHFQFQNIPEGVYHVEPEYLFSNQYNTKEGFRIFEKCSCLQSDTYKPLRGYYIAEGIEEIRKLQKQRYSCGYCGKQYIKPEHEFCTACLNSEYLKLENLHLLRLKPVYPEKFPDRAELTEEEKEILIPLYKESQGLGKIKREKTLQSKNRKRVENLIPEAEEKAKKIIEEAKIKTEAYTWLLDNELNILDNVIYYSHTNTFCFGWRDRLDEKTKSDLLDKLSEFPFNYEFKKGEKKNDNSRIQK